MIILPAKCHAACSFYSFIVRVDAHSTGNVQTSLLSMTILFQHIMSPIKYLVMLFHHSVIIVRNEVFLCGNADRHTVYL